jgi:hypothetical protein
VGQIRINSRLLVVVFVLTTLVNFSVAYSETDESSSGVVKPGGYYHRNQVTNYFDSDLSKTDVIVAQSQRPYKKDETPEIKESPTPVATTTPISEADKWNNIRQMNDADFDKYITQLGGGIGDQPVVVPNPDAPGEFKAIQACLQRGDYACANAYAEKYAARTEKLEQLQADIAKLTEKKLQERGLMPESLDNEAPDYEDLTILQNSEDLKKNKDNDDAVIDDVDSSTQRGIGLLPGEVQALLSHGEVREEQYLAKNPGQNDFQKEVPTDKRLIDALSIPQDKQREMARKKYQGVIGKDQNGSVRVYVFFRPEDLDAFAMFSVMEKLYQIHKNDSGFLMIGFSISSTTTIDLGAIKSKSKVSFPLRSGSNIASQLGITHSPTIVVASPSTGQYAKEEEIQGFAYFDEVVRIVNGSIDVQKKNK